MPRIPTHLRTTNPEENKAKARKRYRSALIAAVVLTFSTGTVALAAGLGVFTPSNAQTPTASPPPLGLLARSLHLMISTPNSTR